MNITKLVTNSKYLLNYMYQHFIIIFMHLLKTLLNIFYLQLTMMNGKTPLTIVSQNCVKMISEQQKIVDAINVFRRTSEELNVTRALSPMAI